jgi:transcriptional regulator with XRE-family HTH domain
MEQFFKVRNETGRLRVDGVSVRRARWNANLTQADIANRMRRLGYYLPQPYVSMLERGRYPWGFTERMATALAAALGVGVSQIVGGNALTSEDTQLVRHLVSQLHDVLGSDAASATAIQAA